MEKKNVKYYVEKFIDKNPFIKEGLYEGYINSTGLALKILPYIKNKLGEDISFDAVKMAIFRIGKDISKVTNKQIFEINEIFIKKNINVLKIPLKNSNIREMIPKVKGKYYSSIRGKTQKTFIFEDYYKEKVELYFDTKNMSSNLVIIGININSELEEVPGVLYSISKSLFFYGINIKQIIQTHNEFSIVVEEKYLKDAVYAISNI